MAYTDYSGPCFQRIGNAVSAAANGAYGRNYGRSYGGDNFPMWLVPDLAVGSADLADKMHQRMAGVKTERDGRPVGYRKGAQYGRWPLIFQAKVKSILEDLRDEYWTVRRFYLWPSGTGGSKWIVFWEEDEFPPITLRGGYFNLDCTIVEVP